MFTPAELQVLLEMCDLSLKSRGLSAVNAVIPVAQKIDRLLQEAAKAKQESPEVASVPAP